MHLRLLLFLTFLQLPYLQAEQDIYSFEKTISNNITTAGGADIELTTNQYVHGKKSLRIGWNGTGGTVIIKHPIPTKNQIVFQRKHAAVFHSWIYSPSTEKNKTLRFEFGTKDSSEAKCWFDYTLNFKGWRTFIVPFNRMDGKETDLLDWCRIQTPKDNSEGHVYLDLLLPSQQFDRRHAIHDNSFQFTRDDEYSRLRLNLPPIDLYHQSIREVPNPSISTQQHNAVKHLEQLLEESLLENAIVSEMSTLRKQFDAFEIGETDNDVFGKHIYYYHTIDVYRDLYLEDEMKTAVKFDLKRAGSLLLKLAQKWHSLKNDQEDKRLTEEMIISLYQLLLKSGWQQGHGQGTLHHFGYTSREFYAASFLLRELLEAHSLREPIAKAMQWFNDAHYCFDDHAKTHYADLDYFNTLALPQLQALLMAKAPGERFTAVTQWKNMLSAAIANDRHGNNGGFKEDGTAYHHWGHYPAYETGAIHSLSFLFKLLSQTEFRLSEDAYHSFRNALLALRSTSNLHSWPRSLSGRHAYPQTGIAFLWKAYADFAKAGTPDGEKDVDPEIAAAAVRLSPAAKPYLPNTLAEAPPNGHWSYPYGHISAHRRSDWLAVARGFSRYVWASEIYDGVNRYGRYQSHGTLEILPPGGLQASGVSEDGWDWSRPPGATVTHLPVDQLPFEKIIMMPTSNETFVATTHLNNQQGLFAMILQEKFEKNRPDIGLHARKSYSFFDNMIVCMGSAIASPSEKYPAETILFQQHLPKGNELIAINDQSIDEFPFAYSSSNETILQDVVGNYYYVPSGHNVQLTRRTQSSRYHYPKRKGHDTDPNLNKNPATKGDYATAWIDHGKTAKNATYLYAILVQPDEKSAKKWSKSPPFRVIQQDATAHIVRSNNTTTYSIFEASHFLAEESLIREVSKPCAMITKQGENSIQLAFTDPDLRMPGGEGGSIPGEIFVPTENGEEVSSVEVILSGTYTIEPSDDVSAVIKDGNTHLTFTTRRGRTYHCVLKKQP